MIKKSDCMFPTIVKGEKLNVEVDELLIFAVLVISPIGILCACLGISYVGLGLLSLAVVCSIVANCI